jgi:hypothetical protein
MYGQISCHNPSLTGHPLTSQVILNSDKYFLKSKKCSGFIVAGVFSFFYPNPTDFYSVFVLGKKGVDRGFREGSERVARGFGEV